MTIFCWLPPDRFLTFCCRPGVLIDSAWTIVVGGVARLGRVDPADPVQEFVERRQHDVGFHIHPQRQAIALAVFGQIADAVPHRVAWALDVDPLAVDVDFAGIDGVRAKDRPRDFGAPRAHQPGKAEDFAFLEREADVFEHPPPVEVSAPPARLR